MYKKVLTKITTNQKLTEEEIFDLVAAINNNEITDVQIAGFQVGLLMKGTSSPHSQRPCEPTAFRCGPGWMTN